MSDGFYRAFEEHHRGPRELIKSRLRVYQPFVEALSAVYDAAETIDLGCGRGEWLELLQEWGFEARGVDLDDGMLAACRERGLNVLTEEAVKFLKELPDSSQAIVSGFHIAEHIPFPDLQVLVQEALRTLKPGGLLILETPNPENVVVGTASFYLDPTHQRPLPPGLLSFLPEHYGFERVKTLRLQESKELATSEELTLFNVLAGVSPDYAVVAQKAGDKEIMAAMDAVFATEFGLPLDYLAGKYDQQALNRAAQAQQALDRAAQAEAQVQQALDRAAQAQAQARQASDRAEQAEAFSREAETLARQALDRAAQAEARASQAEIIAQGVTTQLSAVYSSTSWVVTKPLRACKRLAVGDFSIFGRLTATSVIKAKQALRSVVSTSSPPLHQRLGGTAMNTTIPANDRHVLSEVSASMSDGWRSGVSLTLRSPLSRRIYMDLKAAIENEKLGED